jgi:5-methylcytosine-specific restriction endonuclease McrA
MQIQKRKQIAKDKWLELLDKCNFRCYYCNSKSTLIREHFIPIVRGGSIGIENIVPACVPCNKLKGTSTGSEYLRWLKFLYFAGLGHKPIPFCNECGKSIISKVLGCSC